MNPIETGLETCPLHGPGCEFWPTRPLDIMSTAGLRAVPDRELNEYVTEALERGVDHSRPEITRSGDE
jgi:hypothetical protein